MKRQADRLTDRQTDIVTVTLELQKDSVNSGRGIQLIKEGSGRLCFNNNILVLCYCCCCSEIRMVLCKPTSQLTIQPTTNHVSSISVCLYKGCGAGLICFCWQTPTHSQLPYTPLQLLLPFRLPPLRTC